MATRTDTTTRNAPHKNAGKMPGSSTQNNVRPGNGEEAARDELYGVVSVLYHALQGAQTYTQYRDDARKAGDEELVEFFDTCRDEETARAHMAKILLADRIGDISEEDETDEDDEESTSEEDS